ncbi:MAG: LytTR family transcriptional regulator DNA-binding domain-containing protein [Bacteroidota bacterium]
MDKLIIILKSMSTRQALILVGVTGFCLMLATWISHYKLDDKLSRCEPYRYSYNGNGKKYFEYPDSNYKDNKCYLIWYSTIQRFETSPTDGMSIMMPGCHPFPVWHNIDPKSCHPKDYLMFRGTLKAANKIVYNLPFVRTHRSYIVNINYALGCPAKYPERQNGYIILKSHIKPKTVDTIPISEAKFKYVSTLFDSVMARHKLEENYIPYAEIKDKIKKKLGISESRGY